jgi:hypothetical protein
MIMLEVLHQVETLLPQILKDESRWKSVFVNYHPPFVERLWTDWGNYRIYLHLIYPCNDTEALFHPHPWPSAMKIINGRYEMWVGHGEGMKPPLVTEIRILCAGDEYEMIDPNDWHSVRPLEEPSLSLMVTGIPWARLAPKSDQPLTELTLEKRTGLFKLFRVHYR